MIIRRLHPAWWVAALLLGLLAGLLPWLAQVDLLWAALGLGILLGGVFLLGLWPWSGLVLLIVAALFTRYRFDVGPVSVRPEHVAALAVAAVGGFQVLIQRRALRFPLAFWLALIWWGMNVVSGVFFSPRLSTGVQNSLRLSLLVLTFFLIINLIGTRRAWWLALALFLTAGVLEAAFGIVARAVYPFGINLGVQVAWNFTEPIPYGTFEEGNLFGSHTASWAIVLAALTLATWGQGRRRRQAFYLGGLLILLLGLFLSLSRGAWLMFAAGMTLLWVVYRWQSWHTVNRFLLLITAAPFLVLFLLSIAPWLPSSWPFVDRLQSFLNLSSDATFSARLSDWSLALRDWLQQPLTGWGPGSFYDLHGELRAHPAWISNLSIRLLQETGLIGAAAFVCFALALFLPAIKTLRAGLPRLEHLALLGLTISLLVLWGLAYQSTDGIWLSASWVHAGLLAAGSHVLRPHVQKEIV